MVDCVLPVLASAYPVSSRSLGRGLAEAVLLDLLLRARSRLEDGCSLSDERGRGYGRHVLIFSFLLFCSLLFLPRYLCKGAN